MIFDSEPPHRKMKKKTSLRPDQLHVSTMPSGAKSAGRGAFGAQAGANPPFWPWRPLVLRGPFSGRKIWNLPEGVGGSHCKGSIGWWPAYELFCLFQVGGPIDLLVSPNPQNSGGGCVWSCMIAIHRRGCDWNEPGRMMGEICGKKGRRIQNTPEWERRKVASLGRMFALHVS